MSATRPNREWPILTSRNEWAVLPTDLPREPAGRFLARSRDRFNIPRMSQTNRADSIEHSLIQTQELDLDACEHLARADGLLSDAEAIFTRLAEPGAR
jgi:hypothetical protein